MKADVINFRSHFLMILALSKSAYFFKDASLITGGDLTFRGGGGAADGITTLHRRAEKSKRARLMRTLGWRRTDGGRGVVVVVGGLLMETRP